MVGPQHTVKINIAIGFQAGQHIGLTHIVPGFFEFLRGALYIPEMHEENLVLAAKMANYAGQVAGHKGEITLAQSNTIHRTRYHVKQPVIIFDAAHDPAYSPNW